ncbi:hypothetical protein HDU89_001349 [Geranomyces variabilis]|nr:hypothetical protein HDU89_001349 [Geranomyces variabilis]
MRLVFKECGIVTDAVFAPHGVMLKRGDTIKRKKYDEALRAISEHGADVFYTVWIADPPHLVPRPAMSIILALVPSLLLANKTQPAHVGEVQDAGPARPRFNGPCGDVIRVANELESYRVVDRHAVDKG